ncbi:hypothetical protein [Bradyrhizobium sp. USDA 4520]
MLSQLFRLNDGYDPFQMGRKALAPTRCTLAKDADDGLLRRMMEDEPEWETNAQVRERLLDRAIIACSPVMK